MAIERLIRRMFFGFLLKNINKKCESGTSLLKIKTAQVYVCGVKKARIFFLCAMAVMVAFALLISGLSLIQKALFTYSTWSSEVKLNVALVIGGIELVGGIVTLIYLFREESWGNFFGIRKVVTLAIGKEKVQAEE